MTLALDFRKLYELLRRAHQYRTGPQQLRLRESCIKTTAR
jgi:hypothetical protein